MKMPFTSYLAHTREQSFLSRERERAREREREREKGELIGRV